MALAPGHLCQGLAGEWPQRDGTEEAGPDALLASELDALLGNARRAAESHDQAVGVVALLGLIAHLLSLYLAVLLLQVQVALLHDLRLQLKRGDDVRLAAARASRRGPRTFLEDFLLRAPRLERRQHHFLHHLADDAVAENHRRIAVAEGQREGQVDKVGHLLHRGRRQHDDVVVAVAAAARGLEIVALTGLDSSQAGAATLHIDNDAGYLGAGHIGNALLHERYAGARRGGQHPLAGASAAIEHIDGGHLALSLQDHHARGLPGLEGREGLNDFGLWCDGIAEEAIGPTPYGSAGKGLVAFHKHYVLFHDYTVFCSIAGSPATSIRLR